MNLRQRVIKSWQSYKEKQLKEQKFVKFLATQSFEETVLPMFPLGIDVCRRALESWNSPNFQAKLSQHKSDFIDQQNQFGCVNESLGLLAMSYSDKISMFETLIQGWKKEKDSYARYKQNNSSGGPTIEELDDW